MAHVNSQKDVVALKEISYKSYQFYIRGHGFEALGH